MNATSPRKTDADTWHPWTPTSGRGSVLLIAELANAHEGSPDTALKMIDAAADAGCGAVKFQKFYADEMLSSGHPNAPLFERLSWPDEAWQKLVLHASQLGLHVFVDVFGERAYDFISGIHGVSGLKVHGADMGNTPLLDRLAKDERPILVGTGGGSDLDIFRALERITRPERIVLMHGFQGFPTPLEDTALSRVAHFRDMFGTAVGISEHMDASDPFAHTAPLLAVPLGICCLEKHITLDRSKKGIDFQSSLEPSEMKKLAEDLRRAETAMGAAGLPQSATEETYRKKFKKSLIALKDIVSGETITSQDAAYRIVESPTRYTLQSADAIGQTAARSIAAGSILSHADMGVKTGLCIIARLKSTRLPQKAFADIHGTRAIERLFARAKLCKVDQVVLATSNLESDKPLVDAARTAGLETHTGDPEEPLSRMIACAEKGGWTYIVRVTGDTVFLDPGMLQQAVSQATEANLDYVSMWDVPIGTHCEVISLSALHAISRHIQAPFTSECLSWFLFSNPNFKTADLELKASQKRNWWISLDTPEDLERVRAVVELLGADNNTYTLEDFIATVEKDPRLVKAVSIAPYRPTPPKTMTYNFRLPPVKDNEHSVRTSS